MTCLKEVIPDDIDHSFGRNENLSRVKHVGVFTLKVRQAKLQTFAIFTHGI